MSEFIQVVTTLDSREAAEKIARLLVEGRLAACAQIAGPISSTYWWKGEIEEAEEWMCAVKTRAELYGRVERAIKEAHPYEVPEIVCFSITDGNRDYLSWITAEVTKQGSSY